MSSTYTGDRTQTRAPGPLPAKNADPAVTLPADGDPLTAASVAQAFKEPADFLNFLTHKAGILDQTNAWTGDNSTTGLFQSNNSVLLYGLSGDTAAAATFGATPTHRKLGPQFLYVAGKWVRFYASTDNAGLEITLNAVWGGTIWAYDTTSPASRLLLSPTTCKLQYYAGASGWADGDWIDETTFSLATGAIGLIGDVSSSGGDLKALAGKLVAGATRSSATAGAGQSVAVGTAYADTLPLAWASVSAAGSLLRGANIFSASKSATGTYSVVLNNGTTGSGILCPVAMLTTTDGRIFASAAGSGATIGINTKDTAGVDTDYPFNVIVFGGG